MDTLIEFVSPFYKDKDIMHNISHIERIYKAALKLANFYPGMVDMEIVRFGCYFHGFVRDAETIIKKYLFDLGFQQERVERILKVASESHAEEIPEKS